MNYNVVFITDAGFYIPTVVAVQSLINMPIAEGTQYCINIMYKGLSEKEINAIQKLETECFIINMIDVASKYEMLDLVKLRNHFCTAKEAALLKFEIADIFTELDTILYLDGDIVIKGDISSIFHIDLEENYVGGVRDCGVATYNRKDHEHLSLNFDKYINTGVMLLNLKKIREDHLKEKFYETKYGLNDKTKMDQNVFNLVFDDKIVLCPLRYNCTFPNDYLEHCFGKLDIETLNKIHGTNYKLWAEVHKDAAIIHYSAPIKPWKYSDALVVKYWDDIFVQTPLKSEVVLKRKKCHLPYLTKLCVGRRSVLVMRMILNLETKGFRNTLRKVKKYVFSKEH